MLGSSPLSFASASRRALTLQPGPLPSPVVTRFDGTMGPSDSRPGPACPSRASGWGSLATTAAGLPCCRCSPCRHAVVTTPADPRPTRCSCGSRHVLGLGGGLPSCTARSASASVVSGPARRSLTLRPAGLLSRLQRPVDVESFSRFVTSSTVPTATGRNNQLPGRDSHPLENRTFSRRTVHNRPCGRDRGGMDPTAISPLQGCDCCAVHCPRAALAPLALPWAGG